MPSTEWASERASLYRRTLLEDVLPFWMKHATGSADGALDNCLDDAGNLLSTDRYIWSQGRALWTFSALVNRIERRPEWLEVAGKLFAYLREHGRDSEGRWVYRLDADGNVIDGPESIYVDGFVMNGMGEYFAATGDEQAAEIALETCRNVLDRLSRPGSYGIKPYTLARGVKALGIPMILGFFCFELGKTLQREDLCAKGEALARQVLDDFQAPDGLYREFVSDGGGILEGPQGRLCIPGHVIEAMWFLISIFEDLGRLDAVPGCCESIRRHLELGWDQECGGLRLAVDVEGREPVPWQKPDCEPWWVHTEALVATAYAHRHTREPWCLEWHDKVREYAFSHYPVPTGEWNQWLDRFGNKGETAALPVKDPFHLPRSLIYLVNLIEPVAGSWPA